MFIPTIKKLKYSNEILMERALPSKGIISAKQGQKVEPFTKLGMSKVSYGVLTLGKDFKPQKTKGDGSFFYKDKLIGFHERHKIFAPFDGSLSMDAHTSEWSFKQEERDFWLLSGVWGEIANTARDRSVLVKTQAAEIYFSVCVKKDIQGELLVFPNPSDILEMQYLENFSKDVRGKIIYVGEFASLKLIKRAHELGVGGVLVGGVDVPSFEYAKKQDMFLGIITGFGCDQVPSFIFNLLKEVSNRFVFIYGKKNLLRIPLPEKLPEDLCKSSMTGVVFKEVIPRLVVQVLQKPYFGWIGEVDSVNGTSIFVRFGDKKDVVEVTLPNILAIE